jgi:hypothetical protein
MDDCTLYMYNVHVHVHCTCTMYMYMYIVHNNNDLQDLAFDRASDSHSSQLHHYTINIILLKTFIGVKLHVYLMVC